MEILKNINIRYLALLVTVLLGASIFYTYIHYSDTNKTKSYFDLYLANTYNDLDQDKINSNLNFLSTNKNPDIKFFADLKLTLINQLEDYNAFEKDLITLKHAILKKDLTKLNELQLSNYFNETSSIYYLNSNLSKIKKHDLKTNTISNFFSNAVSLYLNDI
ncbi:MAG: hypothetical protein O3C61_07225 [Proteobacteria bacterium]|nr:hypothetical protein [Pseudomonadota bacterium]